MGRALAGIVATTLVFILGVILCLALPQVIQNFDQNWNGPYRGNYIKIHGFNDPSVTISGNAQVFWWNGTPGPVNEKDVYLGKGGVTIIHFSVPTTDTYTIQVNGNGPEVTQGTVQMSINGASPRTVSIAGDDLHPKSFDVTVPLKAGVDNTVQLSHQTDTGRLDEVIHITGISVFR